MKKSPFQTVKEKFNDKTALVNAVKALASDDLWLDRVNEQKCLERVSNRKLLHLHTLLTDLKSQFGSRSKLIDKVLEFDRKEKDRDYRSRLERFSTPRLWDTYCAALKREKKKVKPDS